MILLFSGGIDSYVAYHFLGKPQTVYFDLNTQYSSKERGVVQNLIPSTIIETCIDFKSREDHRTAYVPYRNLHLAMLANKYSDDIVIAGLKDDLVSDKNRVIFRKFSDIMSEMASRTVIVTSPFWDMTKVDVVKWFLDNGGTADELTSTLSCYSSSDKIFCGECQACFRKWCALRSVGITDLVFTNEVMMLQYYYDAIYGTKYNPDRNENIIKQIESVHPEWRSHEYRD